MTIIRFMHANVMADRMGLYSVCYNSACIYAQMSFFDCDVFASRCEGGCCLCSLLVL